MFKKILATSAIFAVSLSTSFAGAFYVGPALSYLDYSADDVSYSGLAPALYAGYGLWARDWVYLAAEIFGATKSIDLNKNDTTEGVNLKSGYNYGISIIPAFNLDDTLLAYFRLGYIRTKFTSLDTTEGTYQIGVGLEGNLADCWYLRGEYDYSTYSSVGTVGSIRANQVTATLLYRFDSLFYRSEEI